MREAGFDAHILLILMALNTLILLVPLPGYRKL
jgi:hypothetical protein